jgi:UDP-N-acetylglucosamine--dolichyl-phosphate N-acetylglucosaminephosphotransferase
MVELDGVLTASLIGSTALSFLITYLTVPYFNRYMRAAGIVGTDVMKKNGKKIPDMGGPGVITGYLLAVFSFIGVGAFVTSRLEGVVYILAALNTILIITMIGIFDTLTALIRRREGAGLFEKHKKIGIPRWLYFLIPLPAAVPLSAVNVGVSKMSIPFIGVVELGIWYPLVLVPIAVLCCSNATNFLAGFNGLEAGMGFVLLTSLGVYAFIQGRVNASIMSLCFAFSLLAFLPYNWFPAKVFPGDLNYTIGAVVASVTVVGNMEKFAILCFIPYIIEAFLKAASGFDAESYGILQVDGTVKPRKNEIRGLTHLVMKLGNFKEWQVSLILIIFEGLTCLTAFLIIPYI